MRFEAAGATDRGRVRDNNEDAFLCDVASGLFLVADGMGGLAAGEVASRLAVETVSRVLFAPPSSDTLEYAPPDAPAWQAAAGRLNRAVVEANRAIFEESRSRFGSTEAAGHSAMGSTLVGLRHAGEGLVMVNVGDSRAYLSRQGRTRQLSEDHSLVMARVRQGLLRPEEIAASPDRHVIYRALGMTATVEADISPVEARPGDLFLLCSDGLSDVLDGPDLERALAEAAALEPERACRLLIDLALERLSRDNVTVIVLRVLA